MSASTAEHYQEVTNPWEETNRRESTPAGYMRAPQSTPTPRWIRPPGSGEPSRAKSTRPTPRNPPNASSSRTSPTVTTARNQTPDRHRTTQTRSTEPPLQPLHRATSNTRPMHRAVPAGQSARAETSPVDRHRAPERGSGRAQPGRRRLRSPPPGNPPVQRLRSQPTRHRTPNQRTRRPDQSQPHPPTERPTPPEQRAKAQDRSAEPPDQNLPATEG